MPELSWSSVAENTEYELYRSLDDGDYSLLAVTKGSSYIDTTTANGTTYCYKVKALCRKTSAGNSSFSAPVTIVDNK